MLDLALAQIPDAYRHGTPILIRSDSAGCTHGLLAHIRGLREHGVDARFSVGVAVTEQVREAIIKVRNWIPAIDDGELRNGAQIAEITGLVPDDGYPEGTRFIVRRETPHPGAQLSLFDTVEGFRHQVMATDTPLGGGSIQYLEARHRAHARVEDRIRCGKDTGFRSLPLTGLRHQRRVAGTRAHRYRPACLDENPSPTRRTRRRRAQETALPTTTRPSRIGRRVWVRIAENWPWTAELTAAFTQLAALPQPIT